MRSACRKVLLFVAVGETEGMDVDDASNTSLRSGNRRMAVMATMVTAQSFVRNQYQKLQNPEIVGNRITMTGLLNPTRSTRERPV